MREDVVNALAADVPAEIAEGVELIRSRPEGVLGQAITWNPDAWRTAKLELFHQEIEAVAMRCAVQESTGRRSITRGDVIRIAGDGDAVRTFLASMIWGFGPTGYGASRTGDIVRDNPDLVAKLEGQIAAAPNGPEAAWDAIERDHKIRGLGPAFGTKLAYFAALAADPPRPVPLIADLNTSWAMYALVGLRRSVKWRDSYLAYVEIAHRWAAENSWSADEIEWAAFRCWANTKGRPVLKQRLTISD